VSGLRALLSRPPSQTLAYWAWLWRERQWWFLRTIPLEWESVIFTGFRGAGKSTFGCNLCISYLRAGIRVASNYYIRDPLTGLETESCTTWIDVLTKSVEALERREPLIIYLADIQGYCDARQWQYTPQWWLEFIAMARHMGICIQGDTQVLSQVEKRLRMLIGRVVEVEPSWLRRRWRRWPRFKVRDMDLQINDDPALWLPPGKQRTTWLYSHAFHGHSSWEMLARADFADLTTPECERIIEGLRKRADACNQVIKLPSFADRGELQSQEACDVA
jgi:hypothetical protein